jgi:hypothetical protein
MPISNRWPILKMPWSGDGGSQSAAVGVTRTRALGTLGPLYAQHFRPLNLPSRLAGELSHRDPKARLSMSSHIKCRLLLHSSVGLQPSAVRCGALARVYPAVSSSFRQFTAHRCRIRRPRAGFGSGFAVQSVPYHGTILMKRRNFA